MALPTPKLDDRTFQELVDEAKRLVQERCPTWTDHNVSDPGVTLIEAFAWMTDLMLYRLNQVPDQAFIRFLEMVGVNRRAPSPASIDLDFRLSAPTPDPVLVPAGSRASTRRTATVDAVSFATNADVEVQPAVVGLIGNRIGNQKKIRSIDEPLSEGVSTVIFSDEPQNNDGLYIGFAQAMPNHLIVVDVTVETRRGAGIDPYRPPIRWEYWAGDSWGRCNVVFDNTQGFNEDGWIELALPADHAVGSLDGMAFGWVRSIVANTASRAPYRVSPALKTLSAHTSGVTIRASNVETIENEVLGVSNGVAGQTFRLARSPVALGGHGDEQPLVLAVERTDRQLTEQMDGPDGAEDVGSQPTEVEIWELVYDFAASGPDSRHFSLDPHSGVIQFGPLVVDTSGQPKVHGMIPHKGATITVPSYRVGGGQSGNVAANTVQVLKSPIPKISGVDNRFSARGGVDAESVEQAKTRGPIELRVRNRAVTAQDYEYLALEAAHNLARAKAVSEEELGDNLARATAMEDPGSGASPGVRVLLVPDIGEVDSRNEIPRSHLFPPKDLQRAVVDKLNKARPLGVRVAVSPPDYIHVAVQADIISLPTASARDVEDRVRHAICEYLHPVHGGRDRRGWPFGRHVRASEITAELAQIAGVDVVEEVQLIRRSSSGGDERGELIELYPMELPLPVIDHEVQVRQS